MIQTPKTQIEKLSAKLIADLCRTDERPDGWLPHTVYVEEVGEDEKLGDIPVYNRYTLENFKQDGSCTLRDMEGVCRSGHLNEICIDWLIILRERYLELCAEQGIWRERAISILEQETDVTRSDILEFVGDHWLNLASDEEIIASFRLWTGRTNLRQVADRRLRKRDSWLVPGHAGSWIVTLPTDRFLPCTSKGRRTVSTIRTTTHSTRFFA